LNFFSKYDATVKVVRVCLDNGERLIGFQYPEILMPLAEKEATALALENKVHSKLTTSSISVLDDNSSHEMNIYCHFCIFEFKANYYGVIAKFD